MHSKAVTDVEVALPQWSSSFPERGQPTPVSPEERRDMPMASLGSSSVLSLAEMLLKNRSLLDSLTRAEGYQALLIPRFLAIGLASFGTFGLAMAVLFLAASPGALPAIAAPHWTANPGGSAAGLWLAYTIGFVIATGICLPSFYFYGLLAGINVSWLQVTGQIMKGKASTAMMLLGLLPIYVSLVLAAIVFRVPERMLQVVLIAGLGLPFAAGLWGVRCIYEGFMSLADTLPLHNRGRRQCFLRRLTLACSACYTAVTPVLVYTLWKFVAEQLPVIRL